MTLADKAKEVQAVIIKWAASPASLIIPHEIRGAILDMAQVITALCHRIEQLEEHAMSQHEKAYRWLTIATDEQEKKNNEQHS